MLNTSKRDFDEPRPCADFSRSSAMLAREASCLAVMPVVGICASGQCGTTLVNVRSRHSLEGKANPVAFGNVIRSPRGRVGRVWQKRSR